MGHALAYNERLLERYAAELPLNDLPGFSNIMTPDSRYVRASANSLPLMGFSPNTDVAGVRYEEMRCQASENFQRFEEEDRLALDREVRILSYNCFDNWRVFLGHKRPIRNQAGDVIGTLANFIDLTHSGIIDVARFMTHDHFLPRREAFSLIVQDATRWPALTSKECECLFFYIRGCTYKEIAQRMGVQPTTVQTHIEHIKQKLGCTTRSQLTETAIGYGFMSFMPESLLQQLQPA